MTAEVRRGPYAGQVISVDHIIPRAVAPELENVIANLELMPERLNQEKGSKIGDRQAAFPIDPGNLPAVCPKCDEDLIRATARKPLVVYLAHRGESVSQVLAKLDKVVSECLWHSHPSLKVIHGRGAVSSSSRETAIERGKA